MVNRRRRFRMLGRKPGSLLGRKPGSLSNEEKDAIRDRMLDKSFRDRSRLSAGIDHVNAKQWLVTSPDGQQFRVQNLYIWCQENAVMFAPAEWVYVYTCFANRKKRKWRNWTVLPIT